MATPELHNITESLQCTINLITVMLLNFDLLYRNNKKQIIPGSLVPGLNHQPEMTSPRDHCFTEFCLGWRISLSSGSHSGMIPSGQGIILYITPCNRSVFHSSILGLL